jgi:hypothetical protein
MTLFPIASYQRPIPPDRYLRRVRTRQASAVRHHQHGAGAGIRPLPASRFADSQDGVGRSCRIPNAREPLGPLYEQIKLLPMAS